MKKIKLSTQCILEEFSNMKSGEQLAYLFEDSHTVISGISNYNLIKDELEDPDNILVDAAIIENGEEFGFFEDKILFKNDIPNEDYICQHSWYDGGQNSTISYSKCTKCGETVFY